MQKISLITIGKVKTPWISEGCQVYLGRLKHSFDLTERVLAASSQKEEEEKLMKALESIDGTVFVLDAAGKEYASESFASLIAAEKDMGRPLTFVIAGAYGLSSTFKKGRKLLSLGAMTFPHEITKLLLLEQLFRADAITKNTGYHH
ncbi:MAG: 23S rRNA (pseudouridine(1915)-N(3))-methyltransferase RlmH [Candidatus Peribacteraceae bacterium]